MKTGDRKAPNGELRASPHRPKATPRQWIGGSSFWRSRPDSGGKRASRSGVPGNSVDDRGEFDLRALLQDNARMKAICPSILPKPVGPDFFQACPSCRQSKFLVFKRCEPHELLKELSIYACKFCGHELAFGRELPRHVI